MAEYDQAYVAYLTENHPEGTVFEDPPQQIKMVPPFDARYVDVASIAIRDVAHDLRPFTMQVGTRADFGPAFDIPVRLIRSLPILHKIHNDLLDELDARRVAVVEQDFFRERFKPYIVTNPDQPKLEHSQKLVFDNLSIILKGLSEQLHYRHLIE